MNTNAYRDDWAGQDWSAVVREFTEYEHRDFAEKLIPQPEEVLLATYTCEDYNGDAWVVYRQGAKFYEVHGGHCSCYGLEGQWKPTEYGDAAVFLSCLERRTQDYGLEGKYRAEVTAAVAAFVGAAQ